MKVLILTDSLSLPRSVKDVTVQYEQTYPYLLKKKFPEVDFVIVGIGGGTITDIIKQLDYYKVLNPDIFIMQSGIVDCAPRIFKKWETSLIKKLHLTFLFKPFTKLIRNNRGLTYTSLKKFDTSCKGLHTFFSKSKSATYAIEILPASLEYEDILPGITKNIKDFNIVLKKHFTSITTEDLNPKNDILNDHHHLNSNGHFKIFEKLSAIIIQNMRK